MKWVTYYDSIMGGVQDVVVHDDRDSATRYFKRHYKDYFELNTPFNVKLPCKYGFYHRAFYGVTKKAYEERFGKIKADKEGKK